MTIKTIFQTRIILLGILPIKGKLKQMIFFENVDVSKVKFEPVFLRYFHLITKNHNPCKIIIYVVAKCFKLFYYFRI